MVSFSDFHSPHALWLLLAVPLWVLWALTEKRRRAAIRFPLAHRLLKGPFGLRTHFLWVPPTLAVCAWILAVVALARPQEDAPLKRDLSVEGIDVVVALDLSTSMEAADFKPQNRLFVAKEVLREVIFSRTRDRIGLVVFAGEAYTQAPLTLDYRALEGVLNQLKTRVLEDGTAIGDALATSLNRLRGSEAKSKVVVLITDGDNNAGSISPVDAAQMAKSLGIPVYTILVGKGGRVPFPRGTDIFGQTAWQEVEIPINPELLQDIAQTTGGGFYRAVDRESLRQGLNKVLDAMDKTRLLEGTRTPEKKENYFPFLLASFICFAIERLLRATLLRVFP